MGKGRGADATSIKLNQTDPCRTVPCQYHGLEMPGRRAAWVTCSSICASTIRESKTGQEKVQLSWKTNHFAHQGILFIYIGATTIMSFGGHFQCKKDLPIQWIYCILV